MEPREVRIGGTARHEAVHQELSESVGKRGPGLKTGPFAYFHAAFSDVAWVKQSGPEKRRRRIA